MSKIRYVEDDGFIYDSSLDGLKATMVSYDELYKSAKRVLSMQHLFTNGHLKELIDKVIFNEPATIILWFDGSKTVVMCGEGDEFDREKGFAMAVCKKMFGNKGNYYNVFKQWCEDE